MIKFNRSFVIDYLNNYRVPARDSIGGEDVRFLAMFLDYKGKTGITVERVAKSMRMHSTNYVSNKLKYVIDNLLEEFSIQLLVDKNKQFICYI